ncbi:MAG: DUF6525 family protein [Pseudomonadota bacterium]
MNRNLGQTSLRARRRSADPMCAYDSLPTPLRQWLSQAALPWSPVSARKIWTRAKAKGLSTDDALALLRRAETQTLGRDKHAVHRSLSSMTE